MITHKQLSLADIFTDCQNKFDNDKYQFLELLENTIHLDEIVPVSFISHFHAATTIYSAAHVMQHLYLVFKYYKSPF